MDALYYWNVKITDYDLFKKDSIGKRLQRVPFYIKDAITFFRVIDDSESQHLEQRCNGALRYPGWQPCVKAVSAAGLFCAPSKVGAQVWCICHLLLCYANGSE